jgi:hypothetical protein
MDVQDVKLPWVVSRPSENGVKKTLVRASRGDLSERSEFIPAAA